MSRLIYTILVCAMLLNIASCTLRPRYSASDIPQLISALHADDEIKRAKASAGLGSIGAPAVSALMREARDADAKVREWALYAVSQSIYDAITDNPELSEQLREMLIGALNDESMPVRYEAARAIGNMRKDGKPAIPELVRAMDDDDWRIHYICCRALWCIGAEGEAINALAGELDSKYGDVRGAAVRALWMTDGDASAAVPKLFETALGDFDISYNAAEAVYKIGISDGQLPEIINILYGNEWLANTDSMYFSEPFQDDIKMLLSRALRYDDPDVQAKAREIITRSGEWGETIIDAGAQPAGGVE